MISLLVSPRELTGDRVRVDGEAYRHLFRARRLGKGAGLRLTDGGGGARWGEVTEIGPRFAEIRLGEGAPRHDPEVTVKLMVAMPRLHRASWLVEKATELGAAEIRFLQTERTVRRLSEGKLERLRRVAESALEQSHGSTLPLISGLHELPEARTFGEGCDSGRFLDAPHGRSEGSPSPVSFTPGSTTLWIGPEGGWSEAERAQLLDWGCRPWSLGSRVLRVETAAVVALGLVLNGG